MLLEVNIIAPTRHSTWVSNLLVVRKKTCKIRLCVDFRNLNVSSEKDNYLFPYMEHLSQRITRFPMMSLLDGFLGYNQMSVNKEDRCKTTFTTPWGTFEYLRMYFGLLNAGATFQKPWIMHLEILWGK